MAADILIYDSDVVPVGDDQTQHIEVARDLAGSFNHEFGETFVMPKAKMLDSSACVPGTDGEKMSKSYGNTLAVFEEPKALRKQIMRIVTDSRPMEQPKEPAGNHLFSFSRCLPTSPQREAMAATYRRGGFGYGEVKKALADLAESFLPRPGSGGKELVARPEPVREVLGDGAAMARRKAAEVLLRAQRACGVRRAGGLTFPRRETNDGHSTRGSFPEPQRVFRRAVSAAGLPALVAGGRGPGRRGGLAGRRRRSISPRFCCSRSWSAWAWGRPAWA